METEENERASRGIIEHPCMAPDYLDRALPGGSLEKETSAQKIIAWKRVTRGELHWSPVPLIHSGITATKSAFELFELHILK